MLSATEIPEYLYEPSHREVDLSFTDYRYLCRHCLAIFHALPNSHMAISKANQAACVDIWSGEGCHAIEVNSRTGTLRLYFSTMDSPCLPLLLFSGGTTPEDWRKLQQIALANR